MYIMCKECQLLFPLEHNGRCYCGYTETKVIEEGKVEDFLRGFVDVPVTIYFSDVIRDYDENKDYFVFIIEKDYLIVNKTKTERT